jgi:Cu/Ag efflux protein CusF
MTDAMRFNPSSVDARQGETIRFIVRNSGQLRHELVLGTEKDLKDHYEVMKKHPEMEHADPNMVSVAPGQTGEIVWRFTKTGKVDFACLQPGHYDAGMKGLVRVAAGTKNEPATAPAELADGEVRKVDKDAKKITLKHGELKALDMPAMTMVFQVGDPALLERVKVGDKVKFKAEKIGGAYVVTAIEVSR